MNIRFLKQGFTCNDKSFVLGKEINQLLNSKKVFYKKIWFITNYANKSGIRKIKANLKKALKNSAEVEFIFKVGQNTTAEALEEIISLGCKAKILKDYRENTLQFSIFLFESEEKSAQIFISQADISEDSLYKIPQTVIQISYDFTDKDRDSYQQFKSSISYLLNPKKDLFYEISKDIITQLLNSNYISKESEKKKVEKKNLQRHEMDILSIILPSGESIEISLNDVESLPQNMERKTEKEKNQIKEIVEVNELKEQTPDDVEIEIANENILLFNEKLKEITLNEIIIKEETNTAKKNKITEEMYLPGKYEVIDIEQLLYQQSRMEPSEKKPKKNQATQILMDSPQKVEVKKDITSKKIIINSSFNRTNPNEVINSFFIQINDLKGKGFLGEVRMPVAARDFAPEFWGWPNCYTVVSSNDKYGKKCKQWQVKCKIIDVDEPQTSQIDTIILYQQEGKTTFNLFSKVLLSLNPKEKDILRIIRNPHKSEFVFQCELIRTTSKEYSIWEQYCSKIIKGTERRYGFA